MTTKDLQRVGCPAETNSCQMEDSICGGHFKEFDLSWRDRDSEIVGQTKLKVNREGGIKMTYTCCIAIGRHSERLNNRIE